MLLSQRVLHRDRSSFSQPRYHVASSAKAPAWERFLREVAGEEVAPFLQEFAGYALTTDTSHELALWLYGPPGDGRSTFLAGLGAMLGPRAGLLGLSEIQRNRFALADIPGKTLLTATEQPTGYLRTSHVLNALISGEPIQVEKKYRDPFVLVPRAKIAWVHLKALVARPCRRLRRRCCWR